MSVVPVDDWPLVGRARELARVNAALTRPAGSGVLLAGPSGVGKSRLAGECLRRAADHGFHVEHVRATRSSSQIPLGALAPLLPFDNTGEVAGDVLRGVAAAIGATRDDGRRLLLAVDDAHLLDDASATVVNHLVTSGRCSVMLTVRTGESAPDPVTALWKDLSVERLDIGPLTPDHVDELLTVVLGGRVDGVTRREFWDASHGNALFVRELLLGALDSGVLGHDGTIWRLEQRLASPPRLIELVPRFELGHRAYYLLSGPVIAATQFRYPGPFDGWRNPDLFWPDDRRWFVATDVDFWSLYIGGDNDFIAQLAGGVPTPTEIVTLDRPLEIED